MIIKTNQSFLTNIKISFASSPWRTFLPCGFILLALLGGIAQGAPLGATFNYQGRLIDGVRPPTDNYDFIFSLFDAATGGSPVGTPTTIAQTVGVINGMFTAELDFGSAAFAGDARWLQIQVRKSGSGVSPTMLTPRQLLTLTPYALYSITARTATTASSVPWSALTSIPAGIGSSWDLTGNAGTTPGVNYLGTSDMFPLELKVNGARALRLEPAGGQPNVIGGFSGNIVSDGVSGATISGGGASGLENQIGANFASVGGGQGNTSGGGSATVGGGYRNKSDSNYGTVGGGYQNATFSYSTELATYGDYATVGGGYRNRSYGTYATVGGGYQNTAGNTDTSDFHNTGHGATVPGGFNNSASGNFSFAAGQNANAEHRGSFVWADSSSVVPFRSEAENQFRVRAHGGARFDFGDSTWVKLDNSGAIYTSSGGYLSVGGMWINASDVALKENFKAVNPQKILEQVARLPISTWNYRKEHGTISHLGPMAQDFYAAFHLGADDKHIGTVDEGGVALAAIQGLHLMVKERDAQIQSLQKRLVELEKKNEGREARLTRLEKALEPWSEAQTANLETGGIQ